MSLKNRLVIAFLAVVLVPTAIVIAMSSVIAQDELRLLFQMPDVDVRKLILQLCLLLCAVTLLTAIFLVIWLYREIVKPIGVIKGATEELKKGNLGFSIQGSDTDEIGQLCNNFEEMRIYLKGEMESRIQHERELKELIGNISHDIKTPLTAIKGYSEGLLDGIAETKERQERYLRTICSKANDVVSMVNELSCYMLIDCNQITYDFEAVDVRGYFEDCFEELKLDLEVRGVVVEHRLQVPEGTVMCADREQLQRVISNIIENSVKYGGENPKIFVRVTEEPFFIRTEITDNGIGIAAKDLPYIFDRFYRADSSRSSKTGGTGLGLSIVKKIITEHGGAIWAHSEVGKGTSIIFTLKKEVAAS